MTCKINTPTVEYVLNTNKQYSATDLGNIILDDMKDNDVFNEGTASGLLELATITDGCGGITTILVDSGHLKLWTILRGDGFMKFTIKNGSIDEYEITITANWSPSKMADIILLNISHYDDDLASGHNGYYVIKDETGSETSISVDTGHFKHWIQTKQNGGMIATKGGTVMVKTKVLDKTEATTIGEILSCETCMHFDVCKYAPEIKDKGLHCLLPSVESFYKLLDASDLRCTNYK